MNEFKDAERSWGLPPINGTSPLVQQGYNNTCAIRVQQLILQDFGIEVSEDELIEIAEQNGWFSDGTSAEHVGNLLDYYGVETQRFNNGNVFSLANELAQGHRVMVAVDSGELWEPGWGENLEDFFTQQPDHAVIVAGLDTTDPENITIQLMDPGTGDIAASYQLEQFMDSWQDAGFQMVTTMEPAPPFAFGMENFDYSTSLHVPFVGDMPYGEFERVINYNDFYQSDTGTLEHSDDWNVNTYDSYSDGVLACIKGEITLPQMLAEIFGEDNIPSPSDAQMLDETRLEVAFLGNMQDDLDRAEFHNSWASEYNDLADMYESWGDDDTADWYRDQAESDSRDADYYLDEAEDDID